MTYRLLDQFRATFDGSLYRHRDSSLGDRIAVCLYEDLLSLDKSQKLASGINRRTHVANIRNLATGIQARRGDGTFGELVPNVAPFLQDGFDVARGPVATIEIGVEVKILAKAMIKQIDRVVGDLVKQVAQFQRGHGNPIAVGIVGVNYAPRTTSYEGDRAYPTDGKRYAHPADEAPQAELIINQRARQAFDELLIVRYKAVNEPPFAFEWVDRNSTEQEYGAILTRISREYDKRF